MTNDTANTSKLTGPADTADADTLVTSITPRPSAAERRSGAATATAEMKSPHLNIVPLKLASEHRIDRYEKVAPDGTVIEVARNLDTGAAEYNWTDRRAWPLPVTDDDE